MIQITTMQVMCPFIKMVVGHDMFYAFCRPSKNPRRLIVDKSQKMDKRSENDKIKINVLSK